mmetsp:Transcript_31782/g.105261  ORF Transcript_31782/g.105261 Transcript_31782/m.105261 type:complete len:188 (-) Transcript_31782:149-712(-)
MTARQAALPRRNGRLLAGLALAAAGALAAVGAASQAFVSSSAPTPLGRRALAAGLLPAVLGAQSALAIPRVTDLNVYINRRKLELVPIFKQGMDYLEKIPEVDEKMKAFTPKMANKMQLYAAIFSGSEAPDATVKRLNADAKAFKAAILDNDKPAALAAFEKYRKDIPPGNGRFDLKDPTTFEAPPV